MSKVHARLREVCASSKYIVEHSRKVHGWKMDAGTTMATTRRTWRSRWVQTFLPQNHEGYFVVEGEEDDHTIIDDEWRRSNGEDNIEETNVDGMIENILNKAMQRDRANE